MKIAIIGSGYVGTVTGTCLAELGHSVICTDSDPHRLEKLQQGILPFFEEGLEPLLRTNLDEKRLQFTANIQEAVSASEVVFLCIGTPPLPDGRPDLKPLNKTLKEVANGMNGHKLIVEKSLLPIKTGEWLRGLLHDELPKDASFDIAAVPQFLREGQAVKDFMMPDRIVIGTEKKEATDTLVSIYQPLNAPLFITDINTAVMIKHATNAFLALKISFINSVAQICEKTGADITKVAKGLGMDKRISPDYLSAGIGYGGIFLPKDIAALTNIASEYHINLDLLKAADTTNRYQRINFIDRIEEVLKSAEGKTVAIWGLAYRPNTDDMRDAPSSTIIWGLQKRKAKIRAYDPIAMETSKEVLPNITYCKDIYEAAEGADLIAILTEWPEFAQVNFRQLKEVSKCRIIVDGRNIYEPERMKNLGYQYVSIGRKPVTLQDFRPPLATAVKK